MKNSIKKFFTWEQDGVGVVEIILILVILIGLILLFKDQITSIITNAFEAITGDSTSIMLE